MSDSSLPNASVEPVRNPVLPRVTIDTDGDLILKVKAVSYLVGGVTWEHEQEFLVDSHAMRCASPVWKSMLFLGWAESKPSDGSPWVVKLVEEDEVVDELSENYLLTGMDILLHLTHGNVAPLELVINKGLREDLISYRALCRLRGFLSLCDKYDTLPLIKYWAEHVWQWRSLPHTIQTFDGHRTLLQVGWILGNEEVSCSAFSRIILISTQKDLAIPEFDTNPDLVRGWGIIPKETVEKLYSLRRNRLQDIIRHFQTYLKALLEHDPDVCKGPKHQSHLCNDTILAGIIRHHRQMPDRRNNGDGRCNWKSAYSIVLATDPYLRDINGTRLLSDLFRIDDIQMLEGHDLCCPAKRFQKAFDDNIRMKGSRGSYRSQMDPEEGEHLLRQREKLEEKYERKR
ncbi:hypothetical protein QBC35DRAFT_540452 [Podospora australis]|uniref:BTB domain-containing protein n=1 Tax=Podospora australis TaxID=1536484 RepID=A0AAN6WQ90_9PEZI|nr:hypothetical protein QBC35DRAFT_540452 [Podospora australis]